MSTAELALRDEIKVDKLPKVKVIVLADAGVMREATIDVIGKALDRIGKEAKQVELDNENKVSADDNPSDEVTKPNERPVKLEPRELIVDPKEGNTEPMLGPEDNSNDNPVDKAGILIKLAGKAIKEEPTEPTKDEK